MGEGGMGDDSPAAVAAAAIGLSELAEGPSAAAKRGRSKSDDHMDMVSGDGEGKDDVHELVEQLTSNFETLGQAIERCVRLISEEEFYRMVGYTGGRGDHTETSASYGGVVESRGQEYGTLPQSQRSVARVVHRYIKPVPGSARASSLAAGDGSALDGGPHREVLPPRPSTRRGKAGTGAGGSG